MGRGSGNTNTRSNRLKVGWAGSEKLDTPKLCSWGRGWVELGSWVKWVEDLRVGQAGFTG